MRSSGSFVKGQKQPKSFKSLSAKLDEDKVEQIYIELREGTSFAAIGKMFDVSYATIQNVNKGKYFNKYHDPLRVVIGVDFGDAWFACQVLQYAMFGKLIWG